MPEGIAARERAFEEYVVARACGDAARVAVWVSHQHLIGGRTSAARGWLARAERALGHVPECAGHGWVAVERARHAGVVEEQLEHSARALAVARRTGDGDLEVFALSLLGRAETAAGRPEEGMVLLEEAMAAATSGVVRNVHTLAEAYCNLVMACTNAGEWERAAEWCEHVEEFARTHETAPLWGACRSVHAEVLLARGHWAEAEAALTAALETAGRYIPELGAPAVASLAELRVAQGRLDEAERLLAGREETPAALRSLALLRIADGRPAVAVDLLTRGLRAVGGDVMRQAQLLAALVDARLAVGDADRAVAASLELGELAASTGIHLVRARGALAAARVGLAGPAGQAGRAGLAAGSAGPGTAEVSAERAGEALALFGALAMPLEAAEARLELARSLAERSPSWPRRRRLGPGHLPRAGRGAVRASGRRGAGQLRAGRRVLDRGRGCRGSYGDGRVAGSTADRPGAEVLELVARAGPTRGSRASW